jgi:hypothetical protein
VSVSTIFDTRFASGGIRKQIPGLLGREIGFGTSVNLRFDTITDYSVLVTYLARRLGFPKRDAAALLREFSSATDELRQSVTAQIFDTIVHTDNRAKLMALPPWLRST